MRRKHTTGAWQVRTKAMGKDKNLNTTAIRQRTADIVPLEPGQVICPECFRVVRTKPTTGLVRSHNYCQGANREPYRREESTS